MAALDRVLLLKVNFTKSFITKDGGRGQAQTSARREVVDGDRE